MKFTKIFLGLFIVSAIYFTACSHPDTTKVKIYLPKSGNSSQIIEKDTFLDKIFSVFTSKAYAQTWNSSTAQYILFITASDMTEKYEYISGTATYHEVEVPSGRNRHFILWSVSGSGDIDLNWVGRAVADLEAGGETNLTIRLFPMTTLVDPGSYPSIGIFNGCSGPILTWISGGLNTYGSYFTRFNVYRSDTQYGPFQLIYSTTDLGSVLTFSYQDTTTPDLVSYYYFVSVDTVNGDLGPGSINYLNADPSEFDFFSIIIIINSAFGYRDSGQC